MPPMASTKLQQSLAAFERAFVEEAEADRLRRERIYREAEQRLDTRRRDRVHKHGSMRFVLLVLVLLATAALVHGGDVQDALRRDGLARRGAMLLVEELAARGWPAAEAHRLDGWLLRHTPSLTRRRSNSALPLGGRPRRPGARGGLLRAPRSARARAGLSRRGAHRPRRRARAPGLDARSDHRRPGGRRRRGAREDGARRGGAHRPPRRGWVAAWAACEERPDAEEHARAVLAASNPRRRTPGPPRTSASGSRSASAGGQACSASPPPPAPAGAASRATWSTH